VGRRIFEKSAKTAREKGKAGMKQRGGAGKTKAKRKKKNERE